MTWLETAGFAEDSGTLRRSPDMPASHWRPLALCAVQGTIHESIKALDARGMAAIASGDAQRFADYLQETGNTICGRHAIAILLQVQLLVDGWRVW